MGFTCLGFSNSDHKDIKLNAVYRKNGTRICNIFVFFVRKSSAWRNKVTKWLNNLFCFIPFLPTIFDACNRHLLG